jgi:hypothetical protein
MQQMDCLFMAAGAFDSDKENKLHVSTQRPQRAVQNWEDWTDRGFGICAALPTHPPDEPQCAAVPQSAALRSRAYAPVLQSYCFAADTARQNQLLWLWLETCQTLPCPTQPSPPITMCAVGAINAAQDPEAVPFFARTRRSPLTLAAAPCARLRERGSTLCLWNTDHPAGPRIRKQDQWELERHGQYVPPRLPPPQASIAYAADGISYPAILDTTS